MHPLLKGLWLPAGVEHSIYSPRPFYLHALYFEPGSLRSDADPQVLGFDTLAAAQASAGDFEAATHTVRQAIEIAAPDERDVYRYRLAMYQHARPYRIAPLRSVTQASYQESVEPGARSVE